MWWTSVIAIVLYVVLFIIFIVAWAEIFMKAGYNRWLCFLVVIPIVNLIVFLWFAYSKWPVYELVGKDMRRRILEDKKAKIEQEIESLSSVDTVKENIPQKQSSKIEDLHQQYKQAKKRSEEYFLLAAKYPDNSPEKESNFCMGTEYKLNAETLKKQLENEQ